MKTNIVVILIVVAAAFLLLSDAPKKQAQLPSSIYVKSRVLAGNTAIAYASSCSGSLTAYDKTSELCNITCDSSGYATVKLEGGNSRIYTQTPNLCICNVGETGSVQSNQYNLSSTSSVSLSAEKLNTALERYCANSRCSTDASCGTNGLVGPAYCDGKSVISGDTYTYTCINPGAVNSYCSIDMVPLYNGTVCTVGCESGACVFNTTNMNTFLSYRARYVAGTDPLDTFISRGYEWVAP